MPPTTDEEIVAAPWWPQMLAQKDSLSWAALTEKFGVNATALRRALESSGHTKAALPPGRKPRAVASVEQEIAPPDPRELLRREAGKRPDPEVAALVEVAVDEVKAFRREHGIAPYLRPPPSSALPASVAMVRPQAEPPKGPAGSVLVRRRASVDGEPSQEVRRETPSPTPTTSTAAPAPATRSPLDAFRDQLGKVGDQVIADQAGVSRGTVGDFRRSLGIPAYQGYKFEPGHAPLTGGARERKADAESPEKLASKPGRRSAIDDYADSVGMVPDSEVAAMAGLTAGAVKQYRQRRGVAGFVPEPAPAAAAPAAVRAYLSRP